MSDLPCGNLRSAAAAAVAALVAAAIVAAAAPTAAGEEQNDDDYKPNAAVTVSPTHNNFLSLRYEFLLKDLALRVERSVVSGRFRPVCDIICQYARNGYSPFM